MQINKERLASNIENLGRIGYKDGIGMDRLPYSANYNAARAYVEKMMSVAGLSTKVDEVGNLFGFIAGKDENAKTVLIGSHLDAVYGGGIYDGALGVVAAIEVAHTIREAGIDLNNNLEIVAFTAEEGGDLGGTFGSRSFVGIAQKDADPKVLAKYNLTTDNIVAACADTSAYKAYLELHIEQGPVLWQKKISVGIPTAIASITRYRVSICGEANHAGTTPMAQRDDAMRKTAALITKWYDYVYAQTDFVCNIGTMNVYPGTPTIVPEKVEFILELRSIDTAVTNTAMEKFNELLAEHGEGKSEASLIIDKPPVKLSEEIIEVVADVCKTEKIDFIKMPSGASHDASPIAHFIPTGMIFVPSVNGNSHSRAEFTPHEDICVGTNVLLQAVMKIDKQ